MIISYLLGIATYWFIDKILLNTTKRKAFLSLFKKDNNGN